MSNVPWIDPASAEPSVAQLAEDPYYNILAHRPDILRAWHELDKVFFGPTSTVPNVVKEEARRRLAQDVGCVFCASLGTVRPEHTDEQEALAVAFAAMIATDYRQITPETFEALREVFTDEQIVELTSWLCFKFGSNLLGALIGLKPATPEQVEGYASFVANG